MAGVSVGVELLLSHTSPRFPDHREENRSLYLKRRIVREAGEMDRELPVFRIGDIAP